MRKSNKLHSQRGLNRHQKNLERLKRAKALREFNHIALQVKTMQAYMQSKQAEQSPLLETENS
jgi:hypothetical protein